MKYFYADRLDAVNEVFELVAKKAQEYPNRKIALLFPDMRRLKYCFSNLVKLLGDSVKKSTHVDILLHNDSKLIFFTEDSMYQRICGVRCNDVVLYDVYNSEVLETVCASSYSIKDENNQLFFIEDGRESQMQVIFMNKLIDKDSDYTYL